ncbi:MAG: YdcF family protein [Melioribacteraceae bacterium]|nr:YdcF family protein [Melioribacteraceae bacterium]
MSVEKKYYKSSSFITIGFLSLIFSLILIYLKYEFNDLSIFEFRFDYIGNVLNYFIALATLVSAIILKFTKREIKKSKKIIALILISISFILLVAIVFIDKIVIFKNVGFLFNIPIKKFFTGLFYSIGITIQIYLFMFISGLFFEVDKLYELRITVVTIFSIGLLIIFTLFYVWNVNAYTLEKITEKEYDYGCIPGAAVWKKNKPSPIFEARIRKALELYRKNYYKKIILTGGNAPGEISEAEAAQKYLVNLGVNKKDIILEKETSTTSEQIKYLKKYFSNKKILIVSDGFHLSRITQIAKFFNLKVEGVSSDYTMTLEKAIYYRTRETVALLMFWLFAI